MKKIIKNPTLCIIIGVISLIAALLFAPIWGKFWDKCPWKTWGMDILYILIAVVIVCYLVLFLFKRIKSASKRVIQVLTIVEFAILALIALGCIFKQFNIINISSACQIFALALWSRGAVELFRAYYYRADTKEVYPVWYLAIAISMVSAGAYFFAKPFIQDPAILWIFVICIAVFGLLLLVLGINNKKQKKPISKKND